MKINVKEVGVAEDGKPVLDTNGNKLEAGEYEVELVWQINHTKGWSTLIKEEENIYKGTNATLRQAYIEKVAPESKEVNRDWIEDLSHENGNYMCHCGACGNTFNGHKRRVRCKVCATVSQPEKEVDTIEQVAEIYYPISEFHTEAERTAFKTGARWQVNSIKSIHVPYNNGYKHGYDDCEINIKSTHVPIEEVEKILEQGRITAMKSKSHSGDYAETLLYNLIEEIRNLIK